MSQADDRLKALFALDEPPPVDPTFSVAVIEQVMRQRLREDIALLCAVSIVAAGVLWLIWPTLEPALLAVSQGLFPALGAVGIAFFAATILGGRPASALGLAT